MEKSDNKLEEVVPVDTDKKEKVNLEKEKVILENEMKLKQDKKMLNSLSNQVEMFTDSTSASIDKIVNEVKSMEDNNEGSAKINSLQSVLYTLDNKLSWLTSTSACWMTIRPRRRS